MKKSLFPAALILVSLSLSACCCFDCKKSAEAPAFAPEAASYQLPAPAINGGTSLMKALAERKTIREFKQGEMDTLTLSELLYSANGVNRAEGFKRTIPTAMNTQDLEVFAVLPNAAYHYDAKANTLVKVQDGDHRADVVKRKDFGTNAACVLVYVADLSKYRDGNGEPWSRIHVGSASQNVYLYCAANDLATVSVGMFDDDATRKLLKLNDKQKIILVQPVGFPVISAQ